MNDRTAMVVTVVGSSVGMAALLLTVMTLLIGSVNTRVDDLQDTVNTRMSDLQATMNARIDDTNSRIDDLADRVTVVESEMRELRNLLIEALKAGPPANEN